MSNNETGAIAVPCSLFAGLNAELAPSDIPEGVSPDCQDVVFLPGSVATRPGLHKVLAAARPGSPSIAYLKTFVRPDGSAFTVIMDSAGELLLENVASAPGVVAGLGSRLPPNSLAMSVTADGYEWLAVSDGRQGVYPPIRISPSGQASRASQSGPGAAPTVSDFTQTVNVTVQGLESFAGIASASQDAAGVVTAVLTAPSAVALKPGDTVIVTGMSPAGYNGVWTVETVPDTTHFTFSTAAGLGASTAGGQLTNGLMQLTVDAPVSVRKGDAVILAGNTSDFNNNENGNPAAWIVADPSGNDPTTLFWVSIATASNQALSAGTAGLGGGKCVVGGQSARGVHKCVVMFLTDSGYITGASPVRVFFSAGQSRWKVEGLPLGPANVKARILGFTGAGGGNFYTIDTDGTIHNSGVDASRFGIGTAPDEAFTSTIVPNNTSTSWTLDFPDNVLLAGTPIDVPGNNLFAQVPLHTPLAFFAYASRLFAWGMPNVVDNLLNMDLQGGYLASFIGATPTGWTAVSPPTPAGGPGTAQLTTQDLQELFWLVTGDGSPAIVGELHQPAYQDAEGVAILAPNTRYLFRCMAKQFGGGTAGQIIAELYSASAGSLAKATIAISSFSSQYAGFLQATFTADTPAVIPADTVLKVYTKNMLNGQQVYLGEFELLPSERPYFPAMLASYADNLEAFDALTGVIGPAADSSPIRCCSALRDSLYVKTASGVHETQDNGATEPAGWDFRELSRRVGAISFRAGDPGQFGTGDTGEGWELIADRGGIYIHEGGPLFKISQEVQPIWETINWNAAHTIWLKNDTVSRRAYIGIPIGSATSPNLLLVLDYRELDTASNIANAPPIHISFTGKMIASDLTRKWTRWNLSCPTGELIVRSDSQPHLALGGVHGNFYLLDAAKYTDDDYGQIASYYTTYFFVNHEAEQALGVGSHRKLFKYLAALVSGLGKIAVTPLADSLSNAWRTTPSYSLSLDPDYDLEWGLNVTAERMALKFQVAPFLGQTDAYFKLQHLVVSMQPDPWALVRGAI